MDSEEETLSDDANSECSGVSFDIELEDEPAPAVIEDAPFEVLSTEDIVQHMDSCIRDVNNIVLLPATVTRILLHHFKWDTEKLINRFYDGNQNELYAEAKVINPFRKIAANTRNMRLWKMVPRDKQECEICCMEQPKNSMTGLDCDHRYCDECWKVYLKVKIMDEGIGQTISCAATGCDILVDDASVMRLVKDTQVKIKYQRLITNSFVECNRLLRWCPKPGCEYAVKVPRWEERPVTCNCQHTFCFACGENWHEPIDCQFLRNWAKKSEDDTETANWIVTNTKACPKCNASIEKNGGCNHMTCRNRDCRAEFCWVCLDIWDHRRTGACNVYNESVTRENSKAALERYLFYYARYTNHLQSLGFEHALYASVKQDMENLQQDNMSRVEVQFLKKAVDILCQCRRTLTYTFVFAYSLRKNNQSLIFEENQKALERATEMLSGCLEREITAENAAWLKQEIIDKYKYCNERRNVLVEHVYEGYEKNWWEYFDWK